MGCFLGVFARRKSGADAATGNHHRATAMAERKGRQKKSSEAKVLGFDLEDLLSASAELLGKGAFGTTYRADLAEVGPMVVKRLRDFDVSEAKFQEMVDAIDKANHENLLPLTAYFYSGDEKLLVYDYFPMGSLYFLLHVNRSDDTSPLNWETRIDIALGAARAIAHLHSLGPTMAHGNIKSSNILFTNSFEVRVSEFGLANCGGPTRRHHGYLAIDGTISQKEDVYSFGVLFLELLTGKDPTESYFLDEGMDLPKWMMSAVDGEWTSEVFDVELLEHENVEVLLRCLELAFCWTATDPDVRPSMAQVVSQIEQLWGSSSEVHEIHIDIQDHGS